MIYLMKANSRLEKEAVIKGRPLGQAHNIDIPPPRPKRKPSNPYPRKTGVGLPVSSSGPKDGKLLNKDNQVLDLEHDPTHQEPTATGAFQRMNETSDEGNCSEVLSLFQEAPSASLSSATNTFALKSTSTCKDFVSPVIETNDKITKERISTGESKEGKQLERPYPINMDLKIGRDIEAYLENHCMTKQAELAPGKETEVKKSEKEFSSETSEALSAHGYPRHIPVHVLDGNTEKCMPAPSSSVTNQIPLINPSGGINGNATPFINLNVYAASESAKSSTHQSIPILHPPFYPFQNNQDAFRSPFDISATFWSHIILTLVQNPSVHAAASMAASFGPCPVDSPGEILLGRCPTRHMSPTPSLAALAATTVAAASAWWASHGLLPFCPPIHPTFPLNPLPTTTIPTTESTQEIFGDNKERIAGDQTSVLEDQQVLHPELSAPPKPGSPGSKSSPSSSGSEETVNPVPHSAELKAVEQEKNPVSSTDDPNKEKKARKLVERSSCGSNTPSSSEIETAILKKQGEGQELSNEAELGHLGGEATNRRSRSTGNANDSWKSVSEEGRLAFQALFSREILPQSFSPPPNLRINEPLNNSVAEELKQEVSKKDEDHKLELELYAMTQTPFNFSLAPQLDDLSRSHYNTGKGLLVSEILEHGKMKTDRTGFKPYKRCSVEAKESRSISSSGQTGEKGAKRIRLEGEVST